MKKLLAASVLALASYAGAAQAAPTITFTPGGSGNATGTTVVQSFDSLAVGSSVGTNAAVYSTTVPGGAVRPTTASGNFAAVGAGGSYNITFNPTSLVSFVVGSLDTYNRLVVTYQGGTSDTLSASAITGESSVVYGGADPTANGLVTYRVTSGPLITGLTFYADGANAFEFDTIAAAVPEPAAWGMMILGFGLVGGVMRRRSARVQFA